MRELESYNSSQGYCFLKPNGKYLVRYQYHHHHKLYWAWRDTEDVGEATIFTHRRLPKNAKKEKGYPRGASYNWVSVKIFRTVGVIVQGQ